MASTTRHIARSVRWLVALGLVAALMTVVPVQHLRAATDCRPLSGCSLRDALHAAAPGDTVALAPAISQPFTVTLTGLPPRPTASPVSGSPNPLPPSR